jgi:hypothetical protein
VDIPSYYHNNHEMPTSRIDHIIHVAVNLQLLTNISVRPRDALNASPHDPVVGKTTASTKTENTVRDIVDNAHIAAKKIIHWNKVDVHLSATTSNPWLML